jgi:hypothetical protein
VVHEPIVEQKTMETVIEEKVEEPSFIGNILNMFRK